MRAWMRRAWATIRWKWSPTYLVTIRTETLGEMTLHLNGPNLHFAISDFDNWLRDKAKHSQDPHEAEFAYKAREQLFRYLDDIKLH